MAKLMIQLSDLEDLQGSEKQVKWASQIRSEAITSIRGSLLGLMGQIQKGKVSEESAAKRVSALLSVLRSHGEASWWIENREDYDEIIRDEWADELRK